MADLDAPITAVSVHPALARVTRRGIVTVEAGANQILLAGLPVALEEASIRVAGRGATPARVMGVEVRHRRSVDAPDERVAAAEEALESAQRNVGALDDLDGAEAARAELLEAVNTKGGKAFAQALATGGADPARLAEVADALAGSLREVLGRRRALGTQRHIAERAVEAAKAAIARLQASGRERRDLVVALEADAGGPVELEVDYVVHGAGWQPVYDLRVDPASSTVELTWVALISQRSGEDWPECELRVATSRPSGAAEIPELDPWWIDRWQPPVVPVARAMATPLAMPELAAARSAGHVVASEAALDVDVEEVVADAVDSPLAATWVLPRPTAVPGDGAPHRHVLASATIEARLDHVTAPARSAEAQLRATVINTTGGALLAGEASVFLDRDFVGVARLATTAPGAELELALGVDDRVVVERELARREADKRRLGATRSTSETWTIEITNHRDESIDLVVRDRVPHSRHADIKVTDVKLDPRPTELDDLGRVEWTATVAPAATWTATVGFAIEHPKDLRVVGWR